MTTAKHGKPVPVAGGTWVSIWEKCPKCSQLRRVGGKWQRACLPDKKATHYMGV